MTMLAPFPYFGGKSSVAPLVWERLGDVPNLVEPFFGSGAVLLSRPDAHRWWERTETVNDLDGMLANFWRATQAEPDAVAQWADWPVNENDLHARHAWLVGEKPRIQSRLEGDPAYYDAKVAGWWLWGICLWIGSGWCSSKGPWQVVDGELVRTGGDGQNRQRPHLGDAGRGIIRQRPHLGNAGMGINRQRPHLGDAGMGQCEEWSAHLRQMMQRLSDRLRRVRVCCGDWSRVCGPTPTVHLGLTGVFLDPPYDQAIRDANLYAHETRVSAEVREWALEQGNDPRMRIALCGYEGEHAMPASWECVEWKARGGYGSQGDEDGDGRANSHLERIWFSPHCLKPGRAAQGALL